MLSEICMYVIKRRVKVKHLVLIEFTQTLKTDSASENVGHISTVLISYLVTQIKARFHDSILRSNERIVL